MTLDPEYLDAHHNLALFYLDVDPAKPELARKHYELARGLGLPASEVLEKRLN